MELNQYFNIIKESVKNGYNQFFPSLYIDKGEHVIVDVLYCELKDCGEKDNAFIWLNGRGNEKYGEVFMAYRIGNRTIELIKINKGEVVDKMHIIVDKYSG